MLWQKIITKYSKYRFEISHITIFFIVIVTFQIILTFVQKSSLNDFIDQTQGWYQKHSAERLALITATSLELLVENFSVRDSVTTSEERKAVTSFNVIFKQQLLQQNVEDICLILIRHHRLYVIDTGQEFYDFMRGQAIPHSEASGNHRDAVALFLEHREEMKQQEVIHSTLKDEKTFHIMVPFVPNGEYLGVMYMKITPDFAFLTDEVQTNVEKVTILYFVLILWGLISIYLVSSHAVKERNEAQQQFFELTKENLKKQIRLEKESLFTRRIYHTHHKAEKIIGFIKDDIRKITADTIESVKKRVLTYSNFISRIIYDMKWYDQPVNTILNPMFRTNINEVIRFIIDYVFLRLSSKNEMFDFRLDLDEAMPVVHVNEFVVWEILEPLLQNSIDHGKKRSIQITVTTKYDPDRRLSVLTIADDGIGIRPDLLEPGENGVKRLFLENESTKESENVMSGYGCYIAHQMAVGRCGWGMDAENLSGGGCKFTILIRH
ncbi:MAG: ATP-binding protein [Bacteroidetes bacterium]|nr:ATP-binding protein [Bacteroidota bacterium]